MLTCQHKGEGLGADVEVGQGLPIVLSASIHEAVQHAVVFCYLPHICPPPLCPAPGPSHKQIFSCC